MSVDFLAPSRIRVLRQQSAISFRVDGAFFYQGNPGVSSEIVSILADGAGYRTRTDDLLLGKETTGRETPWVNPAQSPPPDATSPRGIKQPGLSRAAGTRSETEYPTSGTAASLASVNRGRLGGVSFGAQSAVAARPAGSFMPLRLCAPYFLGGA